MPSTITTSYAEIVTALAREYHGLAVDGEVPPQEWFRITTELYAAADHAGISRKIADGDFADEVTAGPVNA